MSVRKVVLVPYDQFKTLISHTDEPSVKSDSDTEISRKKEILKKHLLGKKKTQFSEPVNSSQMLNSEVENKPEKSGLNKILNKTIKKEKNKKIQVSKNSKIPPPPGSPNQVGEGIKKSDLYNFKSPLKDNTPRKTGVSLNDLIAKHWEK